MFQHRYSIALLVLLFATGCTVIQPAEPPALANTAREQIGHMAIRGPTRPTVTLAADLDGKGAAAGKTALSAGAGWLGGTMEAAAQSGDEGGILLVAFGLVTTPIVAAGGAAYGAAVADNPKAVLAGNEVITQSLDFAPAHLRQTLEQELAASAPVSYEFVAASAGNRELQAAGFDSVLDVEMQTIASRPTANRILVYFETVNRMQLTSLRTGQLLSSRSYRRNLEPRAVSGWADRNAASLTTALEESFTDISSQTINELFLAPAIRVKGLEPVSRGLFGTGTIPGRRPLFVWTALDGGSAQPNRSVEYELLISSNGKEPPLQHRTHNMRYVPAESLAGCRTYRWQVRAHYTSFGQPVATDWTPEYRFKTACGD
jgi:hypothetical protein